MKGNKSLVILLFILIFAGFLRFYKISSVPPSLDWDEVAIGWNAKTIFHTRRDEYGTRLPLAFKSFGDYKAPVYIYLTAPIVGIFGMSEINVRFVSAFTGVLSVGVLFFLVKELVETTQFPTASKGDSIASLQNDKKKKASYQLPDFAKASTGKPATRYWPTLSAILLAVSPWHLLLSRPAFEPNLAMFFILVGIWLFLLGLKKPFYFLLCALSFALSFYTYHSPKIFVPVFLLGLAFIFKKKIFIKKNLVWILASAVLGIAILLPLGKSMLFSEGGARFEGTSVFYTKKGEKKAFNLKLITELSKNYLVHYSPKFLFFGGDKNPRIQMRKIGPLLLIEAPFLLFGLFTLIKQRKKKWAKFLLWWLAVGPIPAMIGFEAPHPIRAFNLLPALMMVTGLGVIHPSSFFLGGVLSAFAFLINISYFLYRYFLFYPVYSAPDWQYGHKQVAELAKEYEDKVEKIIITSAYGQPYIFTLFYQKREPLQVFWGAMSKYLYRDINWDEDSHLENVLLVGIPKEIPENAKGKITEIKFPDGDVAFRTVKTEK